MFARRVASRNRQQDSLSGPSTPSLSPQLPASAGSSTSTNPFGTPSPSFGGLDDNDLGDDLSDIQSTSTHSRRRGREADDADQEHVNSGARRQKDTLTRYASMQAQLRSVNGDVMVNFANLSAEEKLVNVKGHLLQISAALTRSKGDALIESSKKIMSNEALEILCNPNLRAYVRGTVPAIMTVAEKKPGTFGLTVGVFQDPHLKKLVSSAISHTMTQRRSFIKGHLEKDWNRSHPSNPNAVPPQHTNIIALTTTIIPRTMSPTPNHMARIALLRACFESWKQVIAPPSAATGQGSGEAAEEDDGEDDTVEPADESPSQEGSNGKIDQFWNMVDKELESLRNACVKKFSTQTERDKAYSEEMTAILQDDFKLHSAPPDTAETTTVFLTHSGSAWLDVLKGSATDNTDTNF